MTCYRQRKLERWTRHTWLRPWRLVSWKTFQGWSKRWKVHTLRPLNYRFSDTTRKRLIKFISTFTVVCNSLQCYDTMFVGCQEGHPACKKIEWWGVGVFISLDSLKLRCHCIPKPHRLLFHLSPDCFYLSGTGLLRLSWKRGCHHGCGGTVPFFAMYLIWYLWCIQLT